MHTETINLYEHYHMAAPGDGGQLVVYALEPIPKVDPKRRFPAVLILPGGAYSWVSPREAEPVAMRFLSRGFTCAILNYSCAPARFPVALREAAMAMGFLREQADRLRAWAKIPAPLLENSSNALPWLLPTALDGTALRYRICTASEVGPASGENVEFRREEADQTLVALLDRNLNFEYPWRRAEQLPSKLTATALKTPDPDALPLYAVPDEASGQPEKTAAASARSDNSLIRFRSEQ